MKAASQGRRRRKVVVLRSAGPVLALVVALAASTASAEAASARLLDIHIRRQSVRDALLDLAVQSSRSLGGDLAACRGTSPSLNGAMTLDAALSRLLAGSGCRYQIQSDGAIIIHRQAVAARPTTTPANPVRSPTPPSLDPAEPVQLSDVVITAGHRPEAHQGLPVSVTAVSGARIESAGVVDTNDLSALVAGMTVTNLGSGRNKILLRGMSDGAFTGLTQSTVALYLDLVPVTYSAPDPDLKLIDIDRVEVLRGPQGTLYGTGPIGGVMRIVTRRPNLTDRYLNVSLTSSETRGADGANTDYSATANLPLFDGGLAIRGSIYKEDFGGYINDVNLNLRSVNDGSRKGGRLAATVRLADDWTATAGIVSQSIGTEDTHYVYRTLGGLRRANLLREPHANDFDEAFASINGQADWGRLDASVALVRHQFKSRYDASSALPSFGSGAQVGALDESKDIRLLVGEFTVTSIQDRPFRWLAGALLSTSTTRADTTVAAIRSVEQTVYGETRLDNLKEFALFGEASLDLTPSVTLVAGARYYGFGYETASDIRQFTRSRAFGGEGDAAGVSPKLAVTWQATPSMQLYGQISQGHRAGGFNTAGPIGQSFSGRVGSPSREYRPDTLWNYETGAKAIWWDGRVQARVSAFVATWSDIQSDQYLPSGLAYAVNVGDGSNKGVEIETNWRPIERLELRANALFADPKITKPSASFNSRGDAGLPGVPAVSANLNVAYHQPLWRGLSLSAEGNLAYVGASRLTFDAARRYRQGDYVTGRITAGIEADHWSLNAFVDNPFDSQANTFSFGDPFRLPEALASTPLRPRTIGVTLRWFPF